MEPMTKQETARQEEERVSQEQEREEPNHYEVRSGDNLWSIAKSNGISIERLKQLNDLRSDTIHPGQSLQLGDGGGSSLKTHQVTSGDTLWDIAMKYDVSIDALQQLNGINSAYSLFPGTILNIPGQGDVSSSNSGSETQASQASQISESHNIPVPPLIRRMSQIKPVT